MGIQNLQRKFPLIIALGCGVLAVVMLNIYLKQKEERVWSKMKEAIQQQQMKGGGGGQAVEKTGVVLVAKRNILPQTLIVAEDIMIKQLPEKYMQPGVATSVDKVIGKIVSSPVLANEQILTTKLLVPGKVGKSLSEITPKGRRAMTIVVDQISTINGFLRPGDFVDVLVTLKAKDAPEDAKSQPEPFTVPFLQGIEVLAVGMEYLPRPETEVKKEVEKAPATSVSVTLALTLQESLLLSYVQDHGKVKLIMHAAEDKQGVIATPVNEEFLLRYLRPELMEEWHPSVPSQSIEVYRGLNKEFMPLAKEKK